MQRGRETILRQLTPRAGKEEEASNYNVYIECTEGLPILINVIMIDIREPR